ncbi:MAG TPA: L,D-transpeptidase family protein [Steroidobacteraceae bacterium]|nr:L,D-transpeptidase family protein [Steroidobacteraceae bacterium]
MNVVTNRPVAPARPSRAARHGALLLAVCVLGVVSLLLPLAPARASTFELTGPDQTIVGDDQVITTVYADTLYDLARKYGIDSQELIRVNPGIDPWLPGAGKQVIIPGRFILPPGLRNGIVVNVPEHRLYYFPKRRRGKPQIVITYPVSVGKLDWNTPIGLTSVTQKLKNPTWYPPAGVRKEHLAEGDPLPRFVPPGPDNPLGQYALRLAAGGGTYLIHGTNNPVAVGMPVTHGCVRLYPDDVAALFPLVPVGTAVHIINQPIKVAWADGQLLLEAHPPINDDGDSVEPNVDAFAQLLQTAVGDSTVAINWDYAREVLAKSDGQLATVGLQADASALNPTSADSATPTPAVSPTPAGPGTSSPAVVAPGTGPATTPAAAPSRGSPTATKTLATVDASPGR